MARAENHPPDQATILHWFEVIEEYIEDCADTRGSKADVFLWKARAIGEAVLSACAEGTPHARRLRDEARGQPVNHEQVARELAKDRLVHTILPEMLLLIRKTGNMGAHVRGPTRRIDTTAVQSCSDMLCNAVEWLYRDSRFARDMPEGVRQALVDLRAGGRPSREERLAIELGEARGRIAELERALEVPTGTMRRVARPQLGLAALGAAVALALIVGLAVGRLWGSSGAHAEAPAGAPSSPAMTVSAAVISREEPDTTVDVASAVVLDGGPARRACPRGTLGVPSGRLALSRMPYPRASWPRPEGALTPVAVEAFCIDEQPVTTREYRAFLAKTRPKILDVPSRPLCNLREPGAEGFAINCIRWSEARDYCEWYGGDLPTVAQWERAARIVSARPIDGTDEWVRDPLRTPTFGYTERPCRADCERLKVAGMIKAKRSAEPHVSWGRMVARASSSEVSFRCVAAPR